ncbi:hypothetical protein ACHAXT_005513 [Thalassiosira profunda]
MDDAHVQPLLGEDDDQPSWVTLAKEGESSDASGASAGSSPWDHAASRLRPNNNNSNWADAPARERRDDELPRVVLLMRLGNMGAAALLVFGSVGQLTNILSLSKMVLGGYGILFGTMVCCLEVNFSFLRHPIASNFGFLYNPFLRLIFYVLMGMISWSFGSLLGKIASIALGLLAVVNTYVLCRYPGYRAALKEISDEEEKQLRKEGRKQAWRYAMTPWWEV